MQTTHKLETIRDLLDALRVDLKDWINDSELPFNLKYDLKDGTSNHIREVIKIINLLIEYSKLYEKFQQKSKFNITFNESNHQNH